MNKIFVWLGATLTLINTMDMIVSSHYAKFNSCEKKDEETAQWIHYGYQMTSDQ